MRTPLYYERINRKLFWPTFALCCTAPFSEGQIYLAGVILMFVNLFISATCVLRASVITAHRIETRHHRTERAAILEALRA